MLGVLKVTQDNNKDVWKYVPLQDFSKNSKIDWAKSIFLNRPTIICKI